MYRSNIGKSNDANVLLGSGFQAAVGGDPVKSLVSLQVTASGDAFRLNSRQLMFMDSFITKIPRLAEWPKVFKKEWTDLTQHLPASVRLPVKRLQTYCDEAVNLLPCVMEGVDHVAAGHADSVELQHTSAPGKVFLPLLVLHTLLENDAELSGPYSRGEFHSIPVVEGGDDQLAGLLAGSTTNGAVSEVSMMFGDLGSVAGMLLNPSQAASKALKGNVEMQRAAPMHKEMTNAHYTMSEIEKEKTRLDRMTKGERAAALKLLMENFDRDMVHNVDAKTKATLLADKPALDDLFNKAQRFDCSGSIAELTIKIMAMQRVPPGALREQDVSYEQWLKWYRTGLGVSCARIEGNFLHWVDKYKSYSEKASYSPATVRLEADVQARTVDLSDYAAMKKQMAQHLKQINNLQRQQDEASAHAAALPLVVSAVPVVAEEAGGQKKQ